MNTKICPKCKKEKNISEFGVDKQNPNGLSCYCLICKRTRGKKYYSENKSKVLKLTRAYYASNKEKHYQWMLSWNKKHPEKIKEYNSLDQKKNPEKYRAKANLRRARKMLASGNGVTADQWKSILSIFGNNCLKCGSTLNITQDHVVPLIKGGAHDVANIQPLCKSCNCHKSTKTEDYRMAYSIL